METNEFIKYLEDNCWYRKRRSVEKESDSEYEDFEYERSYADFIYDTLTVWKNEKKVSVCYTDIGWGYTNYENYDFTYEEFINWWKSL